VTTTFDNFVMPFINYKTGDHATGNIEYYKNSDIAKSVENIEGRTQDYLVTKDKRLISITTMCGGQYLPLESINTIQYIQDELGKVTVLVEGDKNLDIDSVNLGMQKLVREGIDFDTKIVNEIEKSSRGKRVICKQRLNIDEIRLNH
jgi:phenylacetate-CoA ligase